MTREEEIMQHALNYAEKIDYALWLDTEHPKSYAKMLVLATAEDNAKWADEHPKNPWHKTPYSTPDKEAGRVEGKKYLVSVNGEIYKATYEGYGCWTLENGKYKIENEFTEIYWMPIPELPKGGEE